jgi:hypothetical protein
MISLMESGACSRVDIYGFSGGGGKYFKKSAIVKVGPGVQCLSRHPATFVPRRTERRMARIGSILFKIRKTMARHEAALRVGGARDQCGALHPAAHDGHGARG